MSEPTQVAAASPAGHATIGSQPITYWTALRDVLMEAPVPGRIVMPLLLPILEVLKADEQHL